MHLLKIKVNENNKDILIEYYEKNHIGYDRDCGVDLVIPDDYDIKQNSVTKIDLGISCEFIPSWSNQSEAFWLVPRSSIVNTPLQMANSIGIIDPEYRGPIIACVRCFEDYKIKQGTRLFQIVSPDGKPIKIELVTELTPTKRGTNGFGSTNK